MTTLDSRALMAARTAYQSAIPDGCWHSDGGETDAPIRAAIAAYLAATPPQAGEPVGRRWRGPDGKWVCSWDRPLMEPTEYAEALYVSPQPANPAQVTDAVVEAAAKALVPFCYGAFEKGFTAECGPGEPNDHANNAARAALTAAIGAGGQAVALSLAEKALAILTRWTGEAYLFSAHEISKAVGAPKESMNKALSDLIAIGRVERVQCTNGTFYKLAALSQPHPADESVSVQDPMLILAGIKQFGLASDGSDLRDLEASIGRLSHPADERVVEADIDRIAKWMYEASDEDGYSIPWADKRNSRIRAQSRKQVRDVLSARAAIAQESQKNG